ncbi:FtsX-like permease family protein [Streptomyces sp. NPDC052225]|uniref:FtsX-like permease family protein n=1 Tax=Streptomyces sp. NPDC052225 TaxID=3154949 RepID=UPI003431F685
MSVASDLRLAWLLTRGADRLERRRAVLTAVGAVAATDFALAAVTLGSIRGQVYIPYGHDLLNQPGTRQGIVTGLLLLLIPVLGFLGQCARLGAVHRDRRLAGLRLSGAGPKQVRRIAALESGLACLVGAVAGFAVFTAAVLSAGRLPDPIAWVGAAVVTVAVPVLAVLVSRFTLRRVIASPLGHVRRERPRGGPGLMVGLGLPVLAVAVGAVLVMGQGTRGKSAALPLIVIGTLTITGAAAIWTAGASARIMGQRLAERTENPAALLAAHRLQEDPWAAARSHAAVVLVTAVGVALIGIRQILIDGLHQSQREGTLGMSFEYYTFGINLTAAAVALALLISLAALAVGTAESLSTRRRALAAQTAAGVPRRVLTRALLLETALPLVPALVLATAGGTAIHIAYAIAMGQSVPWASPLLVPVAVYACCLLAAATALPLLRRSTHPAFLRMA